MTSRLDKYTQKQNQKPINQVITLQEDLSRLTEIVTYLVGLSDESLVAFDISDQLDSIHRCLNRFETRCLAINITSFENEFVEPNNVEEKSAELVFSNHRWEDIRKDAKRANKLANQLTQTLTKIRSDMTGLKTTTDAPEDLKQINQTVSNTVRGLNAGWDGDLV